MPSSQVVEMGHVFAASNLAVNKLDWYRWRGIPKLINGSSLPEAHMLLDQFRKNRNAIREIGRDAAEKGRQIGLDPSWADDKRQHGHAEQVMRGTDDDKNSGHDLQSRNVRAKRKI